MKIATALIASLLLSVTMTGFSYASSSNGCGGSLGQPCNNYQKFSDTIQFTSTGISDINNSPTPGGTLVGYGGTNVNALEGGSDFVKWLHNYNFNPQVQDPGGIKQALLTISLVNFESKEDEHGKRYGDRNHEHDEGDNDEHDSNGNLKKRGHQQRDNGKGGREDDILSHTLDLSCLYNNQTASSALIQLEGSTAWFNIPSLDGKNSFVVLLDRLYDGSFGVEIKSTFTDFEILWSRLDIEYCPAPVPEPGTLALFGIGLLGLAVYGKRRINNK